MKRVACVFALTLLHTVAALAEAGPRRVTIGNGSGHLAYPQAQAALAAARLENPNVQLGGFFWQQGESDAMSASAAHA